MEHPQEYEKMLREGEEKLRRSSRRSWLLLAVPLILGVAWLLFSLWQVRQAVERKEAIEQEVELAQNTRDSLKDEARLLADSLQKMWQQLEVVSAELNQENLKKPDTRSETWGIVAGGDNTLESASYEARRIERMNLPVAIYYRNGMYRTVVGPFSEKKDAQANYSEIRKKINASAYMVSLSTWCKKTAQQEGYINCN